MPEGASCTVLRTTQELEQFEPAWRKLWREDPRATPFHSPEWLLPWWHSFGQPDVRAVVLSRGTEIIGLLPFYVYREPGAPERRILPIGVSTTDYLGGIYSPACTDEDIELGFRTLLADAEWNEMITTQLRATAPMLRIAQRVDPGLQMFPTESCSHTSALRLSELPQKIRRNAMYYRNRAQREGTLELTIADETNWEEAFEALVRLHGERWQARGEYGLLTHRRVLSMHREAIPRLQNAGLLRLCCLRLNGEIIAVLYSLIDPTDHAERRQYFYLTGYSPVHAELRPGTLLIACAMEHAVEEGVRVVDMLRGDEAYKQIWHMERTPTFGFELKRRAGSQAAIAAVA